MKVQISKGKNLLYYHPYVKVFLNNLKNSNLLFFLEGQSIEYFNISGRNFSGQGEASCWSRHRTGLLWRGERQWESKTEEPETHQRNGKVEHHQQDTGI